MASPLRRGCTGLAILAVVMGLALSAARAERPQSMDLDLGLDYQVGRALFGKTWVSSPSSTRASDGLGPLYNARSCERCHRNNGGGQPLARVGDMPGETAGQADQKDIFSADAALVFQLQGSTRYGQQLQPFAVPGLAAEARVTVSHEALPMQFADGETVVLQRPVYSFSHFSQGELGQQVRISPRLAPPLHGLGLLEAVPAEQILALARQQADRNDGIQGLVAKPESAGPEADPGRFGWQGRHAGLAQQVASALLLDLGIGNPLLPAPWGDCSPDQPQCRRMPHGGSPRLHELESSPQLFDSLLNYVRRIPPVGPRATAHEPESVGKQNNPDGERLFESSGCATCHVPAFELEQGPVYAYTDLLLHDMGEALADFTADGQALTTRWRTAPLWGAQRGRAAFLHDGRARSHMEAVLWHGGEAQEARKRFMSLSRRERSQLLDFLSGL